MKVWHKMKPTEMSTGDFPNGSVVHPVKQKNSDTQTTPNFNDVNFINLSLFAYISSYIYDKELI